MKELKLNKGQTAKVSDEDFEYYNQWNWSAMWCESTQSFYATRKQNKTTILMHREIINTPKGLLCDHINHDTLDDQRHNLRNVTRSQSQMNRRTNINNKLGETGIYMNKNKFVVQIVKERKVVFTKRFSTMEDAIVARDLAKEKYHGKFANQ